MADAPPLWVFFHPVISFFSKLVQLSVFVIIKGSDEKYKLGILENHSNIGKLDKNFCRK